MIKKLTTLLLMALMASVSQALILNWTVLNDARYSADIVYAQLVAVNVSAGDDQPDALYSYYCDLDGRGISEKFKGEESMSALNLEEYMTLQSNNQADNPIGYMTEFGYNGGEQPAQFNFNGYSFYFRMLDAGGNVIANGYTAGPIGSAVSGVSSPDGIMVGWENGGSGVYDQYVFDAAHPHPSVWTVGVPEPCSAALMLLGVSALLLRRRAA